MGGRPTRARGRPVAAGLPRGASADQIAWATSQVHAIRADPHWRGGGYHDAGPGRGPHTGLGIARRVAHITYRSAGELEARFGHLAQEGERPWLGGRYGVESYLDRQAAKLVRRFDAAGYVALVDAMNTHGVGRGRGGTHAALGRVRARTVVAGVDSDRLHPLVQQEELADGIPGADRVRVIRSPHGRDGFLLGADQVAALVRDVLDGTPHRAGRHAP